MTVEKPLLKRKIHDSSDTTPDLLKQKNEHSFLESPEADDDHVLSDSPISQQPYKRQLVWRNIFALSIIHITGLYAFVLLPSVKVETVFWAYLVMIAATIGVQTGAHRLWAHRAYKAHWSLRLILSLLHVMALQNDLYEWCRDHRVHHKWSDTDADPHNANRGFFFSHMGWLMVRKHPEVIRKGKTIDLSDLEADPIVMFQRQFYIPLVILLWGFFPAAVPVYFWGETWFHAFFGVVVLRYAISLHFTWLVNSWAHKFGYRNYDKRTSPVEASIRNLLFGEGFHNYHHTFPFDYSASELGAWDVFNPGTMMIDFYAKLGLAWDLRKPTPKMIADRIKATGDDSFAYKKGDTFWEYFWGVRTMVVPLAILLLIKYTFS